MNNIQDNKVFCMLPWDSLAIRASGRAEPCCRFFPREEWLHEVSLHKDFRNSVSWKVLQEKLIAGIPDASCNKCYRDENSGIFSLRKEGLKNLDQLPTSTECQPIKFLDIAFSNLCNLACVSCSRDYSSTWGAEDYKAGRIPKTIKLLQTYPDDIIDNLDLKDLIKLKLFGGEPFMDQQKFIKLIKKSNLQNLELLVSTNGTVLPNEELKLLIDQCKKLVLDVSLDGIGPVNDWYRWPSKFSEVVSVMKQYDDWWGNKTNFALNIHVVINIYNIWTLDKIVSFMTENFPKWKLDFDWVIVPNWQSLSIIPDDLKISLKEKLLNWAETVHGNFYEFKGNPFLISIERLDDQPKSNLDEFVAKTLRLANERKLNVLEMVPDIKPILVDNTPN